MIHGYIPTGMTLYRNAGPCDVDLLSICAAVAQILFIIPEGIGEQAFLNKIGKEILRADAEGKRKEYMQSFEKTYLKK